MLDCHRAGQRDGDVDAALVALVGAVAVASVQDDGGGGSVALLHRLPIEHVVKRMPLRLAALVYGILQRRLALKPMAERLCVDAHAVRNADHGPAIGRQVADTLCSISGRLDRLATSALERAMRDWLRHSVEGYARSSVSG